MRKLLRSKKGQALVEFAIVLPLLLVILTGIIQFGLVYFQYFVVSNATREGTRLASLGGTNDEIVNKIIETGTPLPRAIVSGNVQIFPGDPNLRTTGTSVEVVVSYPARFDIIFYARDVLLQSHAVMRMETAAEL